MPVRLLRQLSITAFVRYLLLSSGVSTSCHSFAMPSQPVTGAAAGANDPPAVSGTPPPRRWLFLDFDGTCTVADTTPLLPLIASLHSGDDDEARRSRIATFRALEEDYFRAYTEVKGTLFSEEMDGDGDGDGDGGDGGGSEAVLDGDDLQSALSALDDVSTVVTDRVSASACLAGLPSSTNQMTALIERHDELRTATRLHLDCTRPIANAHKKGWDLGVLSINWCPALISAALIAPVRRHLQGEEEGPASDVAALSPKVWSNVVDGAGTVTLLIPGALAKRVRIATVRKDLKEERGADDGSMVVYVGDSSTDLTAMLEADVGILFGRSTTVRSFAEKFGVRMVDLVERGQRGVGGSSLRDPRDSETVWIADRWSEIDEFLEEIGGVSS